MKSMKLRQKCIYLAAICSLLTACQTPGPPAPVQPPPPANPAPVITEASRNAEEVQAWISQISEYRKHSPARLAGEIPPLRSKAQAEPTFNNRLKLALCLAFIPGEENESLGMLEALAPSIKSPEIALIADLIVANVRERRRYRENMSSLQSRNKEAGRQQEDLKVRQESLKRQIEELERKLAALKDIEKSLLQRP